MRLFKALGGAVVSMALVAGGATAATAAPAAPDESTTAFARTAPTASAAPAPFTAISVPSRISVGAPVTELVVSATADRPDVELVYAGIFGTRFEVLSGYGESLEPMPLNPQTHQFLVELYADELAEWGSHVWAVEGVVDLDSDVVDYASEAPTDVRATSTLQMASSRSGGTVTVTGVATAYENLRERYGPWGAQDVAVQVRTGATTWAQIATARTDARGKLTARVDVPVGAQLRLVTRHAPKIWGATSNVVKR